MQRREIARLNAFFRVAVVMQQKNGMPLPLKIFDKWAIVPIIKISVY